MCLTFHIRVEHFFGVLKKKVFTQNINLLSHFFFSGLPNLGAQLVYRCPNGPPAFYAALIFLEKRKIFMD